MRLRTSLCFTGGPNQPRGLHMWFYMQYPCQVMLLLESLLVILDHISIGALALIGQAIPVEGQP